MACTIIAVLGSASAASAQSSVFLVWSNTTNPAHAGDIGTPSMNADVGDIISLDVQIFADAGGVSGYTITLVYDEELLDLLDEVNHLHSPPISFTLFFDSSIESGTGGPAGQLQVAGQCPFPCFLPIASATVTVATISFEVNNSATPFTQLSTGGPDDDLLDQFGASLGPSFASAFAIGPAPLDTDLDGVPDLSDNCPDDANTDQANQDEDPFGDVCDSCMWTRTTSNRDRGGIGAAGPDGAGDLCQNADFSGDGVFDLLDVVIGRRALAGLEMPDPALPPTTGCAPSVTEESIGSDLRGCQGTVTWANRASLCASSWSVCTAADWVGRHGSQAPAANYWTDDNLLWNGSDSLCWVDESVGSDCGGGNPMRVCSATVDGLGNPCNWVDCGYQSAPPPNHYFGGCVGNPTAGTLCCR